MALYQILPPLPEPDRLFEAYRTALTWAAPRADRFELAIEPGVYDRPDELAALMALGRPIAAQPTPDLVRIGAALRGRAIAGDVDEQMLVRTLTSRRAPPRARAGDTSPVEEVFLYLGDRALYVSYDYGTVQTVDVGEDEMESLRAALRTAGLPADSLIPISRRPVT